MPLLSSFPADPRLTSATVPSKLTSVDDLPALLLSLSSSFPLCSSSSYLITQILCVNFISWLLCCDIFQFSHVYIMYVDHLHSPLPSLVPLMSSSSSFFFLFLLHNPMSLIRVVGRNRMRVVREGWVPFHWGKVSYPPQCQLPIETLAGWEVQFNCLIRFQHLYSS